MEIVTDIGLWALLKHVGTWLRNLDRASNTRKAESKEALRAVIVAARGTKSYVRQLEQTGVKNFKEEAHLSEMWTILAFLLQDLGMSALAKRCDIKGKFWSNPDHYDSDFLEKADIALERMEGLARQLLHAIDRQFPVVL